MIVGIMDIYRVSEDSNNQGHQPPHPSNTTTNETLPEPTTSQPTPPLPQKQSQPEGTLPKNNEPTPAQKRNISETLSPPPATNEEKNPPNFDSFRTPELKALKKHRFSNSRENLTTLLEEQLLPSKNIIEKGADPSVMKFVQGKTPRWRLRNANWELFSSTIEESLEGFHIPENIDDAVATFTNIITQTARQTIGKTKILRNKIPVPWWNQECEKAIRDSKN
ncbi:hypothetical protein JTB14_000790 [Gonioctena quinquepunctata]|nr:hypothetical protein JTB14_000790 [Gonioctena quinquepunctata]